MASTFQRKVMPQNAALENHNFMDEDGVRKFLILATGE